MEVKQVQIVQANHAERLIRLEKRQTEDAAIKSVWNPSPFPSVLGGTPQHGKLDAHTWFTCRNVLIGFLQDRCNYRTTKSLTTSTTNKARTSSARSTSMPTRNRLDAGPHREPTACASTRRPSTARTGARADVSLENLALPDLRVAWVAPPSWSGHILTNPTEDTVPQDIRCIPFTRWHLAEPAALD